MVELLQGFYAFPSPPTNNERLKTNARIQPENLEIYGKFIAFFKSPANFFSNRCILKLTCIIIKRKVLQTIGKVAFSYHRKLSNFLLCYIAT